MKQKLTFTPTEVRQNFFSLLKLAEEGRKIIIKSKGMLFHLKLESLDKNSEEEKMKALEEITKLNIKLPSVKKIKKILDTRLSSC